MATALVTGASGGIGEDLARLLAAARHDLVLVARGAGKMESLAAELSKAHGVRVTVIGQDLATPDAAGRLADALAERRLTIDVLVNNAGFGVVGPFAAQDPAIVEQMLHLNVTTLLMLTRRLLPGMLERRNGRILNVGSTAAFQPGPLMAVYYATKAFVLSFSEALWDETRDTGVTVTCLCPGPTHTGFSARADVTNSRLFRSPGVMSSQEVARAGFEAMMAGTRVVIPGTRNRLLARAVSLLPRRRVLAAVRSLHHEA